MKKSITIIFWALLGIFFIILAQFFIPLFRRFIRSSNIFLIFPLIFFILGITLAFFAHREENKNRLRSFLLLTGISASGFFICILLHNVFYALGTLLIDTIILKYLIDFLGTIFFLLAVLVCPLSFLVGVVGFVISNIKDKKLKNKNNND